MNRERLPSNRGESSYFDLSSQPQEETKINKRKTKRGDVGNDPAHIFFSLKYEQNEIRNTKTTNNSKKR